MNDLTPGEKRFLRDTTKAHAAVARAVFDDSIRPQSRKFKRVLESYRAAIKARNTMESKSLNTWTLEEETILRTLTSLDEIRKALPHRSDNAIASKGRQLKIRIG